MATGPLPHASLEKPTYEKGKESARQIFADVLSAIDVGRAMRRKILHGGNRRFSHSEKRFTLVGVQKLGFPIGGSERRVGWQRAAVGPIGGGCRLGRGIRN